MPKKPYMAHGFSGVRGKRLQEDLLKMSDLPPESQREMLAESTRANLQRTLSPDGPKPPIPQMRWGQWVLQYGTDHQKTRFLEQRIAELRRAAQQVDASGTGNVQARDTYLQAADTYMQRLNDLRAAEGVE